MFKINTLNNQEYKENLLTFKRYLKNTYLLSQLIKKN